MLSRRAWRRLSFSGGVGTVIGVVTGVIILQMHQLWPDVYRSPYWQYIIKGAIIIFAVALDSLKYARRNDVNVVAFDVNA